MSIIKCKNCGNDVDSTNKFCSFCGNNLIEESIEKCPECGTIKNENIYRCLNCGYEFNQSKNNNKVNNAKAPVNKNIMFFIMLMSIIGIVLPSCLPIFPLNVILGVLIVIFAFYKGFINDTGFIDNIIKSKMIIVILAVVLVLVRFSFNIQQSLISILSCFIFSLLIYAFYCLCSFFRDYFIAYRYIFVTVVLLIVGSISFGIYNKIDNSKTYCSRDLDKILSKEEAKGRNDLRKITCDKRGVYDDGIILVCKYLDTGKTYTTKVQCERGK